MKNLLTAATLIDTFELLTHPEGGFYRENYRARLTLSADALPAAYGGSRNISTAIYFLLEAGTYSAFHKIHSDECWHFYAGGQLNIYVIDSLGNMEIIRLGDDIEAGELFQYVVPGGCWFASEPASGVDFSFVGCTVAPGFDFRDFEMAKCAELVAEYPKFENEIKRLCREPA